MRKQMEKQYYAHYFFHAHMIIGPRWEMNFLYINMGNNVFNPTTQPFRRKL